MREDKFKVCLRQSLQQSAVKGSKEHLAAVQLSVRAEADRGIREERISFWHFLGLQIKFIGWKVWVIQGIFLWVLSNWLRYSYREYFWENSLGMIRLLVCLAILVLLMALPFLCRSVRCQMQEVEAVTYFASAQLLAAKLAVIGLGNAVVLGGIFVIAVCKTALPADDVLLYLVLPFLVVGSGVLFMLGHFKAKAFFYGSMGLCVCLLVLCVVWPQQYGFLFQQSFSWGWLMVCGCLVVFCFGQLRYIWRNAAYIERQVV